MTNHIFDELKIRAEAHGFTAEVEKNQLLLRADDGSWGACVTPDSHLYRVQDLLHDNEKTDRLLEVMRPEVDLVREYVSRMEDGPVIRAGGDSWRELAGYDGVVLAGKYSDQGGCRFVTWRRGQDGGMELGHYFETDFAAAKTDFAVRSGLVAEQSAAQSLAPERHETHIEEGIPTLKTNAVFKYKEACLEPRGCVVEKVIPLSGPDYDVFSRNLLRDHAFIRDHSDLMYRDENGTMHCLLVTGEDRPDGILVQSEGYDYARYTALLPNAQDWLQAHVYDLAPRAEHDLHRSPALDSLCNRLTGIVDDIAHEAVPTGPGQQTAVDLRELEQEHGLEILSSVSLSHTVHTMLCERPELSGIDFQWDKSEIIFTPMEPELGPGPTLDM